jgi:hypothetical protein
VVSRLAGVAVFAKARIGRAAITYIINRPMAVFFLCSMILLYQACNGDFQPQ